MLLLGVCPAVIRYHALQNRAFSVPEVRKNMCMYLINQGGYKMRHFKGMSYEDIRPIFEKVWDQIHSFVPMDSKLEILKLKRAEPVKRQSTEEEKKRDDSSKPAEGRRKKTLARKRASEKDSEESMKKEKLEDDTKKEDLKAYLDIILGDDVAIDIESLATKYPIVNWKTYVLAENFMYYQIFKADGSSKNYRIFSEMLDDFDRQDVLDLHSLVKERYMISSPKGYDLMLWGDLKTLFELDEEDEVWRHQHEYNLISWRLFDSCAIHILLMDNGIAIDMMIEKKYPLTQEMLSKMLSRKLEVDHGNEMAFELLRPDIAFAVGKLSRTKKLLKVNQGLDLPKPKKALDGKQGSSSAKAKKANIPSEILQWYDDLSLDEQRIVYKGRLGSSSRNAATIKPEKPKSRSKHLAPTTPITRSTSTTLLVPTKRPPLVTNCVLGLTAV
ncbi:hypothetical protein Tco_0397325 [Tanacetum coccineum]